jgi:hypothetical protein
MEVVEKGAFSELQPRSGFEMLTKLVATAPFGMARSQFHASYRSDLEDSGSTVLAEVRRGPALCAATRFVAGLASEARSTIRTLAKSDGRLRCARRASWLLAPGSPYQRAAQAASNRRFISSKETSSTCVANPQLCPKGSVSTP